MKTTETKLTSREVRSGRCSIPFAASTMAGAA